MENALPELPEVETMARGIRPFVMGRKLTAIRRCRTPCRPISIIPEFAALSRQLRGQTVTAVNRLGKRIVLEFANLSRLVIEPRMTGLLLLSDPPDREHLRLQIDFDGARDFNSLWFWDRRGLGTVRLYSRQEWEKLCGENRLGPDALTLTPADWAALCRKTGRPIKVALLDQKLVAGIGNLYASEILHVAAIHPARPADQLSRTQIQRLEDAARAVLEEAIRYEGSTLGDGTYRNALNQAGTYQNVHRVYQKHGTTCPRCMRGIIERTIQAQRSTFFCPQCQK